MSRFLVKYRKWLFALMTVLAVVCALLVPHININTDMTRYLPDSYPMKQGLDVLSQQLPALGSHMQDYGSVFASGNDLMPKDLPRTLAIGVALLFGVLLLMCTSVMEVPIFLLTTGFAVVINMGTNALLPSVSMLTNTITPVLQMVLSMDYCIILMNRYRQEKALGQAPEAAMAGAIGSASSSILSSAFTTIVSLLMLCFIKLRIGADLGVVLAKGVTLSMLCNFTVLPFLILATDKAVEATRKPVLRFPAAPMARFERRFRWPLLVLFVGIFFCFNYLRTRTPLTFEPQYETTAADVKSDENILLLLYPTSQADAAVTLLDSLSTLPEVHSCVSYPSLVSRPLTAPQMAALFRDLAPDRAFPEELLPLVYYARFRPERTERLSLDELQALADTLAAQGLVPADRLDPGAIMNQLMNDGEMPDPAGHDQEGVGQDGAAAPEVAPVPDEPATAPQVSAPETPDTLEAEAVMQEMTGPAGQEAPVAGQKGGTGAGDASVVVLETPYTYEELTTPLTAAQQAAFLGGNPREVAMVYRMAGKKNQTMTPAEFLLYSRDHILTNKRLSLFVSKESAQELRHRCALVDSVLAAGPAVAPAPAAQMPDPVGHDEEGGGHDEKTVEHDEGNSSGPAPTGHPVSTGQDEALVEQGRAPVEHDSAPDPKTCVSSEESAFISDDEDTHAFGSSRSTSGLSVGSSRSSAGSSVKSSVESAISSPLERLTDMALSGRRYTAEQTGKALRAAGIAVSPEELDLLYLYAGARRNYQPEWALSPAQMLDFLADTLLASPALAHFVPDSARTLVSAAREELVSQVGQLLGPDYSAAVVMSGYPAESAESFAYMDLLRRKADDTFPEPHYWIGETEMYKELQEGFPAELLLLTLLTVLSIFFIVALNFRSLLLPVPLVMTILSGVYANVWASGLGGQEMYYLAYLIVQGILMGATIDYSILFTHYYLENRRRADVQASLQGAYQDASHSILTSGLILVVVPFVMAFTLDDPMIAGILRSLGTGSLAVVLLMMLVLPGVLAALDPLFTRRFRHERP